MAHQRRESVAAAAALFGGDSTSNDLFSIPQDAGDDGLFGPPSSAPAVAPTTASGHNDTSADASALFGSSGGGEDLWAQVDTAPQTNESAASGDWAGEAVADDPYASQGWYDEYGQWHEYNQSGTAQQDWSDTNYTTTTTTDAPAHTASTYDYSYANYAPVTTAQPASANSYDPSLYQPAQPKTAPPVASNAPSNAYTPYAQSSSAYDPYRPSTTAAAVPPPFKAPVEPPTPAYAYETPPPRPTILSKQESASSYRPKTYDAYDPPIIEKRPRKNVAHQAPLTHAYPAAYGQPPIQSYQAPPPSLPPPPPPASKVYGHNTQPTAAPPPPANHAYANAYGTSPANQYSSPPPNTAHSYAPPNPSYDPYGSSAHHPPAASYAQPPYAPPPSNSWQAPPTHSAVQAPPAPNGVAPHQYGHQTQHYDQNYAEESYSADSAWPSGPSQPDHQQPSTDQDWYAGHESTASYDIGQTAQVHSSPQTLHTHAAHASAPKNEIHSEATADDWFDRPHGDELGQDGGSFDPEGGFEGSTYDQAGGHTASAAYASTAQHSSVASPPTAHGPLATHSPTTNKADLSSHYGQNNDPYSPGHIDLSSRSASPYAAVATSAAPPPPKARVGSPEVPLGHGTHRAGSKPRSASPGLGHARTHTASPVQPPPMRSQTSSPSVNPVAAAHLKAARSRIASPETTFKAPPPVISSAMVSPPASSSYDPYRPTTQPSYSPPTTLSNVGQSPYAAHVPLPPTPYEEKKTFGFTGEPTSYDPYAPPAANGRPSRHPSLSETSEHGYAPRNDHSTSAHSPYAPITANGMAKPPPLNFTYPTANTAESIYTPMSGLHSKESSLGGTVPHLPTAAAYAPLASASGSDDFLGRAGARIPLISFGFGGKILTCFHTQLDVTSGFDVSLAPKKSSPLIARTLNQLVTESTAMDSATTNFPGPLFSDPGTPTVNLARTATSTAKAKKALVIKYLEERIAEIESGLGHLVGVEESKLEAKLSLVKVLKVMVDHDGKVSGSPEIESEVRAALVPRLARDVGLQSSFGFTTLAADALALPGDTSYSTSSRVEHIVAEHHVTTSSLDKIQELLLQGDRRAAYRFALDHKMWAHAMVISSSLDKEAWKEAVGEFIKTELGVGNTRLSSGSTNGRESLRVAYSMFAGQGSAAVQELLPPKMLAANGTNAFGLGSLSHPPALGNPAFAHQAPIGHHTKPAQGGVSVDVLSKWSETAAIIVSNQMMGDLSAATALGDCLASNKWTEAAHVCFLLSLASSTVGGVGASNVRMVLVGSEGPHVNSSFHLNQDALIFSEIFEFALSLNPVPKGQEPFGGLPHLQAYRLIRASQLAEMGHVTLANRYCEAIGGTLRLNRPSPYYTASFLTQLKELSDRLLGAPMLDKSGSWIARKMTKPSLDTIGSWLEGRLTKFIAGEGEEEKPKEESDPSKNEVTPAGPFAQYSVISSANTSPNASSLNLAMTSMSLAPPSTAPPKRSGSAAALRPPFAAPTDRSASASDYTRPGFRQASPGPQIYSAGAVTTSFYQADSPYNTTARQRRDTIDNGESSESSKESPSDSVPKPQNGPFWGSYGDESAATPTVATFYKTDEPLGADDDSSNFISLMDSTQYAPTPSRSSFNSTTRKNSVPAVEEEEEDLGFGNASSKKKEKDAAEKGPATEEKKDSTPTKPDPPPAKPEPKSSGSWFRLWGKKEESAPAPVKANLGEETSFYYDKELKRWVNKKVGDATATAAAPLPPPPSRTPSRAQTASPGASALMSPTNSSAPPKSATPPPRPATTNLVPPLKAAPPKRSHLAESYVPTPEGDDLPLPPSRPMSAAPDGLTPPPSRGSNIRRKGKSRYVDVFQQEQNGSAS